jgi:hypothetical protein
MNDRQINEMLSYLDCEDRITCLKVASALKNEFGDAGYPTFHSFCMNANNYEQLWVESNWKSADPAKATIALLAYLAGLNGGVVQVLPCSERTTLKVSSPDDRAKIDYARSIWRRANTDDEHVGLHPYAIAKEIHWAAGAGRGSVSGRLIGENADCLIIPIYDLNTDSLQGVQCVNAKGVKQTFGRAKGGGLIFGNSLRLNGDWAVAEGWASTVACVHWHGFDCAVCSFGNSRFDEVYDLVSNRFSPKQIFMMVENDD